jgi:predicted ABC-type ATPase
MPRHGESAFLYPHRRRKWFGKSTLTNSNLDIFASFPILDPDVVARTIQSTITASPAITAGRPFAGRFQPFSAILVL